MKKNPTFIFAVLAVSLGLMLFFAAWRIGGQPLPFPQEVVVSGTNAPEFVRSVLWIRDTNASSYTLNVNSNLWTLPAVGTNGATMAVSNVGFNSGMNMLSLIASNTNGSGTNSMRYYIAVSNDASIVTLTSTNFADVNTSRGSVTNTVNLKPRGKDKQRYFWLWTNLTNYVVEGAL